MTRPVPGGAVAFSPDGRWVAGGGGDNTVIVWDAATGQKLLTLAGPSAALAFSADARKLAGASVWGGVVKVWELWEAGPGA